MTEAIKRPAMFDRFTSGGRRRIEAYRNQVLATEFTDAEQKFTSILTSFKDRLKALSVKTEEKIFKQDNKYAGISPKGTSINTRRVVTATRLDESRLRVSIDTADSFFISGTLQEDPKKPSLRHKTEGKYAFERRIVEIELTNKQGEMVVDTIKDGSRKNSEYDVKELRWDDANLVVEPVEISDMTKKTEALKFAAFALKGCV